MNKTKKNSYSAYDREMLMEKVQMRMSEKRFIHVLGVEEMAVGLAARNGVDVNQASIAALTHDYAKERPDDEMRYIIETEGFDLDLLHYGNPIWHGIVGAYLVEKELGIHDPDILEAIRVHTTGAADMTPLAKVLFVSDYVEKNREFPGVEQARKLALEELDQAVYYEMKHTLQHLIEKNQVIYPPALTAYNAWCQKGYQL